MTFRLYAWQCLNEYMLEIKCGSDLIRTDLWSKNMGLAHFIQKVITSQDLSDNTNFLAVSNYMGH